MKRKLESTAYLQHEISTFIFEEINQIPKGRAKYCAQNSVRFIHWAHQIYEISPIIATFNAMHATEEAVTAFVSAAKINGYAMQAKKLNVHNHTEKAVVAVYAQRLSQVIENAEIAFALNPQSRSIALRTGSPPNVQYHSELTLSLFSTEDDMGKTEIGNLPTMDEALLEERRRANIRNALMYASEDGYPDGFLDPIDAMSHETKLTLGLLWATLDIQNSSSQRCGLIEEIFNQLVSVVPEQKGKSS